MAYTLPGLFSDMLTSVREGKRRLKTVARDYSMQAVIDGKEFVYSSDFTLAANTSIYFLIRTGAIDTMISGAEINAFGTEILAQGFKTSTVSSDGTPVTLVNANAQSSTTPLTELFQAPTVTDEGIIMSHDVAYAATQGSRVTLAEEGVFSVFLLNKSEDHLLKLTNRDALSSCKVSVKLKLIEGV